jgi:hypothetical protein
MRDRIAEGKARILPEYILHFDPEKSEDEDLRCVFHDELARTLWMAIKGTHITSQHFNKGCLQVAKEIRKSIPLTAYQLRRILGNVGGGLPGMGLIGWGQSEDSFGEELLPYVLNEKKITYRVDLEPATLKGKGA